MLQSSLSALLHNYGINHRGLCACIAVPIDQVEDMPTILSLMTDAASESNSDFVSTDIDLVAGGAWLDVSKDVNVNLEHTEEDTRGPHGKLFTYQVTLSLPNDDFTTRGKVMRAYDNRQWLLIAKQRTGEWRLLGSKERGCDFSASLKTGTIGSGANGYIGSFTWQSPYRALYLETD
jgi:hypothetical protein